MKLRVHVVISAMAFGMLMSGSALACRPEQAAFCWNNYQRCLAPDPSDPNGDCELAYINCMRTVGCTPP